LASAVALRSSAAALALDLQHPEQVALSERSHASYGGAPGWRGIKQSVGRWFRALGFEPKAVQAHASALVVSRQMAHAAFIVVAMDLSQQWRDLSEQLRLAAERVLRIQPGAPQPGGPFDAWLARQLRAAPPFG
jgi:hypothetical protein